MRPEDEGWPGGSPPALRLEAHFGDRIVPCFAERPASVSQLLADAVRRNPDAGGIVCGEARLSWPEAEGAADALAGALAARGIEAGDRVALLLGNGTAFPLALFATLRLGAIAVPLGIRQQGPEIAHALADCGAAALIHDGDLAERLPAAEDVPTLRLRVAADTLDGLAAEGRDPPPPPAIGEEDTAVILYTSGTTGRPKGAMLTHLGLVHSASVYVACMGLDERDRSLAAVPLSHVTGLVANLLAAVRCAGTLVIMLSFKAADFLALAERERMTHTIIVPAMYSLCLLQPDVDSYDLSAWRIGGFGGAPMPPPVIARLAERLPNLLLMNAYGATETTSPATLMPPALAASRGDSVGRAVPGATIIVVDEAGRAVAPGEVGEIWIGGPAVVAGYWRNPAATAEAFTAGHWHSGDLGSIDADGFVRVLDRKKDMINRGGYKVFTAEVETVLAGHPDVLECAVVAKPCEVLGERVHAVVVTRRADAVAPDDLAALCRARLADYKTPETFTLTTDPLPRNANGKILKRVLRDRLAAGP